MTITILAITYIQVQDFRLVYTTIGDRDITLGIHLGTDTIHIME
jgi:hypothetical protein